MNGDSVDLDRLHWSTLLVDFNGFHLVKSLVTFKELPKDRVLAIQMWRCCIRDR